MRRVVISGLGVVTPLGTSVDDYWQGLLEGRSGISRVTHFDPSDYPSQIGGEVKDFDPTAYAPAKEARRMDRFTQFAIAAARAAMDDAGTGSAVDPRRFGVIIGSGIGGLRTLEDQHKILLERGPSRISPFLIPMMIPDLAAGQVSMTFGLKGPNYCTTSACSSSAHAIGEAFEAIRRGSADAVLTGGAEAPITPLGLGGFCALRALSTRNDEPEMASRPFDKGRDGFVIGEGAGIVVLEEEGIARARGAKIYAELVGYGATGDAYHITAPDPEGTGAAEAMRLAMAEAGVDPTEIDYINAHGTSTKYNDEFETLAIKSVFGPHAYKLAVSSTKSMTGHLLGGSGGIEFVAMVMAVTEDVVPPTANLDEPDPLCDLDYVPHKARQRQVRAAMSNSFGFGGHNATLLIKKYQA